MIDTRNTILRVIEENVDGCGSDAVMYVMFSKPINNEIQNEFQTHLRDVKYSNIRDDYDTENMIDEAVDKFNASAFAKNLVITAHTIDAPYYGIVTF